MLPKAVHPTIFKPNTLVNRRIQYTSSYGFSTNNSGKDDKNDASDPIVEQAASSQHQAIEDNIPAQEF